MINQEFVERYELEIGKNPRSRVFAALSEAYRKMGRLEDAKKLCRRGVAFNPDFAGGYVAYAKVLLDLEDPNEALRHLENATKLSPDNLLAHSLLGDTLILLRRPKDALNAFKMVLFLNPGDKKALEAVRKWEFLTADEYGEDVFSMQPLFQKESGQSVRDRKTELERAVSLADAFTVRNDLEAALEVVENAIAVLGPQPEIEKRQKILKLRLQTLDSEEGESAIEAEEFDPNRKHPNHKRLILESLLQRINHRRG